MKRRIRKEQKVLVEQQEKLMKLKQESVRASESPERAINQTAAQKPSPGRCVN